MMDTPVSRRNALKNGLITTGALVLGGITVSGNAIAHEGGVGLLPDPPGNDTLFHVLSDTGNTHPLTPSCIGDGEYDEYKIQFWRETGSGIIQTGQRSFLVPAGRHLTVTGSVADEDDLDPGDLHELHNEKDCSVPQSPWKFKPMKRANFKKVNPGKGNAGPKKGKKKRKLKRP